MLYQKKKRRQRRTIVVELISEKNCFHFSQVRLFSEVPVSLARSSRQWNNLARPIVKWNEKLRWPLARRRRRHCRQTRSEKIDDVEWNGKTFTFDFPFEILDAYSRVLLLSAGLAAAILLDLTTWMLSVTKAALAVLCCTLDEMLLPFVFNTIESHGNCAVSSWFIWRE